MLDKTQRKDRLRFLIEERAASPRREALRTLLRERSRVDGISCEIQPRPLCDPSIQALNDDYQATKQHLPLVVERGLELGSAIDLFLEYDHVANISQWEIVLGRPERLGLIVLDGHLNRDLVGDLCSFDGEMLWIGSAGRFIAILDLVSSNEGMKCDLTINPDGNQSTPRAVHASDVISTDR